MRKILFLMLFLQAAYGVATEKNDNITGNYYVQLYKSQLYTSDFNERFNDKTLKTDYMRLQEYLDEKTKIMRILRNAAERYSNILSYSQSHVGDYMRNLKSDLEAHGENDKIVIHINSTYPAISFNGIYSVAYVDSVIYPEIKQRYEQMELRDSIHHVAYTTIQGNIETIQQDVFLCEQAIQAVLSPEIKEQEFRVYISLTFSGLIAVLLILFFWIIYRRSDRTLSNVMLSDSGLQFITVFILIIAIILFGILKIIGGSELAAILSGISGYILGKSGKGLDDTENKQNAEKYFPGQELNS